MERGFTYDRNLNIYENGTNGELNHRKKTFLQTSKGIICNESSNS